LKKIPPPRVLPRGRVAQWTREQIEKLNKEELQALLANAVRLQEPEVAELCRLILRARPRRSAAVG
jgi:hypothetical protein